MLLLMSPWEFVRGSSSIARDLTIAIAFSLTGHWFKSHSSQWDPQSPDHLVAQKSGELCFYEKSGCHPSWTSNQNKQIVYNSPLVLPAFLPIPHTVLAMKPWPRNPKWLDLESETLPSISRNVGCHTTHTHTHTHYCLYSIATIHMHTLTWGAIHGLKR